MVIESSSEVASREGTGAGSERADSERWTINYICAHKVS